ncbi:MAG: GldG family protein [Oscillospiraceae bacterium]|nr:GldG family protein [Oscillospiraceae bacterium]
MKKEKAETKKSELTPEEEQERALKAGIRKKKLKYGTLSSLITIVFVAIVVAVNVICGQLDKRFNWNIDLTSNGLYELDEQTIEYLNKLGSEDVNDKIQITMLADESYFQENSNLKVVAEVMNRFRSESNGRISIEYVDPNKNPEAISKYSANYTGNLTLGDAVVAHGDLVRVLSYQNDLVKYETSIDYNTYQQTQKVSFIGEQSLISAIMGVTDLNPVKLALISQNNGQAIYDQYDSGNYDRLRELLSKNNYEYDELDIVTAELTEDYDMAILCSPSSDLTDAQVEKLSNYLNNNGKYNKTLMYFGTPFKRSTTPNLDNFLALWGIQYSQAIVTESDEKTAQLVQAAYVSMISNVPVARVSTEASLNAGYTTYKLPIVVPYALPITAAFEQNSGRNTYPLLLTSDTCCLYPLDETSSEFDMNSAEKNTYTVALLADQTFTVDNETVKSQIIAFGSAWMLDYYVAGSTGSYDNASYFMSLMNTATGRENVLTIAEKSLDQTKITITEAQAKTIRTVTVLIIPLVVAVLGIVVYVRRKNL